MANEPRHSPRGPLRLTAALLLTVGVVAAGCGRSTESDSGAAAGDGQTRQFVNETRTTDTPVTGGSIVYGIPGETNSFNPTLAQWASYSLTEARTFFDWLAVIDEQGKAQPYLAESFEHDADYRTWTVTLRDGISFTNGKPLTAEAVVRGQQFVKASPVVGETMNLVDSFEVKDRRSYVVHMNKPWASYPEGLASQIGAVVDPDWLVNGDIYHPVGTGPFTVDSWELGKQLTLQRNPNYWRKDERGTPYPYLDSVVFKVIPDEAARADALRRGDIDLMLQTLASPTMKDSLAAAQSGKYQAFSDRKLEGAEDYVLVNTSKAPLNDVNARRALAMALDLKAYVAEITSGVDEPADGFFAPGSPWYTTVDYPTYNATEARRLVEEVKARNGGSFTVNLLAQESQESARLQQWLQAQWAKVGIDVRLDTKPQQTKIILMVRGDYDLALTQQFDDPNPANAFPFWKSFGKGPGELTLNFSRLADPVINGLVDEAMGLPDVNAQKEKWGAVQQRLAQQVPYVWLAHASRTVVASPALVNVVRATSPGGAPMLELTQASHPLHQVWIKR
jgi:peptide/nickel transport system substrate-binding protein